MDKEMGKMTHRLSAILYGSTFFASLALTGCFPPVTTKPQVSASPPKPLEATVKKETTARKVRESTAPSSLEAWRRGVSPATPASSPLKEIYFDFDRYYLRADARDTLQANAAWLKANPAVRVEIEGHADERGTNEYNLAPSGRKRPRIT